ncbi:MAG TPA: flagellar hook capping FlgD N-terminal domain-containing protein [Acetobacteraceae bacterium]|nr:flagellar hook capping FlgD N-terminal domain-containing protein [Acetobacteraceae bacterium]
MTTTSATQTASNSLISSLGSTASTTKIGAQASDGQMNTFLQLLTAQLKNQDPTKPTDPTQFVAQLAQFSQVEQQVNTNTKLDTINKTVSGMALGQYTGMVNHTVTAAATSIAVPASGSPSPMSYTVTSTSLSNIQANILDSSGNLLRSLPVNGTSGTLSFDGRDSSGNALAAGTYQINLVGQATDGTQQSAGTFTTSGVVSQVVQASDGTWQLQLQDGRSVDASSVSSLSS